VSAAPTNIHPHIAAIGPTEVRKRLRKHRDQNHRRGIISVERHERADAPYAVSLLRGR